MSPEPSTLSEHLTTTMVDIYPYGAWLLIIYPYGAKPSICVDSCVYQSEKNRDQVDSLLETTTLPNPGQDAPDLLIHLPLGLIASTTS